MIQLQLRGIDRNVVVGYGKRNKNGNRTLSVKYKDQLGEVGDSIFTINLATTKAVRDFLSFLHKQRRSLIEDAVCQLSAKKLKTINDGITYKQNVGKDPFRFVTPGKFNPNYQYQTVYFTKKDVKQKYFNFFYEFDNDQVVIKNFLFISPSAAAEMKSRKTIDGLRLRDSYHGNMTYRYCRNEDIEHNARVLRTIELSVFSFIKQEIKDFIENKVEAHGHVFEFLPLDMGMSIEDEYEVELNKVIFMEQVVLDEYGQMFKDNRYYDAFSNLSSVNRERLVIDGKPYSGAFDLSQCHPTIIANESGCTRLKEALNSERPYEVLAEAFDMPMASKQQIIAIFNGPGGKHRYFANHTKELVDNFSVELSQFYNRFIDGRGKVNARRFCAYVNGFELSCMDDMMEVAEKTTSAFVRRLHDGFEVWGELEPALVQKCTEIANAHGFSAKTKGVKNK